METAAKAQMFLNLNLEEIQNWKKFLTNPNPPCNTDMIALWYFMMEMWIKYKKYSMLGSAILVHSCVGLHLGKQHWWSKEAWTIVEITIAEVLAAVLESSNVENQDGIEEPRVAES